MLRLFKGKARHGLRAFSLTTYMLFSPALAGSMLDIESPPIDPVSQVNEL